VCCSSLFFVFFLFLLPSLSPFFSSFLFFLFFVGFVCCCVVLWGAVYWCWVGCSVVGVLGVPGLSHMKLSGIVFHTYFVKKPMRAPIMHEAPY